MKDDPFQKLVLLAVSAGMTSQEFGYAIRRIQTGYPLEAEEHFRFLRATIRQIPDHYSQPHRRETSRAKLNEQPVQEITDFIKGSELRTAEAVFRIRMSLSEMYGINISEIPELAEKEGISRWVSRVANTFGITQVLNATVAALNNSSGPINGWRLSNS